MIKRKNIQVLPSTHEKLISKMKKSDKWDSFLCSLIEKAEKLDNIEQFGMNEIEVDYSLPPKDQKNKRR